MFGLFKKAGQRARFEAEMIPQVTASGFDFERILSIYDQGQHTDSVIKVLEDNGEPFNEYDFTAVSYFMLALRAQEATISEKLRISGCAYIIENMPRLSAYSKGLLQAFKGPSAEGSKSTQRDDAGAKSKPFSYKPNYEVKTPPVAIKIKDLRNGDKD